MIYNFLDMVVLNEQQQKAVEHIEGPLLVLAGAGSGKTRVVTHRIAHLISLGVPASDIVAVTFTNKATTEMRERITGLCSQSVLTSTFHSLCLRILKESIQHIGYDPQFVVYDESDAQLLVKQCLKKLNIKDEKATVKSVKHAIGNAKNHLRSPDSYSEEDLYQGLPFKDIYQLYQETLKEYNALDFDDLLFLTAKLFEQCPEALNHYQNQWQFLLIDEYQDTNHAQYQIAKYIVGEKQNIFAVGDPDQSIYSWRGADINNIMRFKEDFQGAEIIELEQNYRSTQNILLASNSLIQKNTIRYEKNLWSDKGHGEKIHFKLLNTDLDEAKYVIQTILDKSLQEQLSLSDCVIFYRTNSQSRPFEDQLMRNNIPYRIIGGISFYDRREIKDILAYIRILLFPSDFLGFSRIINAPKRGFGKTTLERMGQKANELNLPIIDFCRHALQFQITGLRLNQVQKQSLYEFLRTYDQLSFLVKAEEESARIINQIVEEFDYLSFLKEDPDTFLDRSNNIDELCTKAIEYHNERENATLKNFLDEISLQTSSIQSEEGDKINLMTLHNSKGLEFELVCMVGLEEDLFPHVNSKDTLEEIEEERRLCYVGMTRAKKFLYLSGCKYRILWGKQKFMRLSRFLHEIDAQYIDSPPFQMQSSDELDEGAVVEHRSFGKGIIKKKYQSSLGITYDVFFFDSQNLKTLVGKFAKLTNI